MRALEAIERWKAWWEQERQRLVDEDPEFCLYWVAPPGESKDRLEAGRAPACGVTGLSEAAREARPS